MITKLAVNRRLGFGAAPPASSLFFFIIIVFLKEKNKALSGYVGKFFSGSLPGQVINST